MRIAMLSWESMYSILIGGVGVHVTELAAALQRRGHEIHVITRRSANQSHYDLYDGVHYHRVDHELSDNFVEAMDFMGKSMAHRFHEVTSMIGNFELLHAHDWHTANAIKYIMDGYPGLRSILTMHSTEFGRDGNVFFDGLASWIRDVEAAGCRNSNTVIAVSHFLKDEIMRIYQTPSEKIHVVPNAVNYHEFDGFLNPADIKGQYGISPLTPTVFSPGRMTLQKGFDILVEAVPLVRASFPETRFIISGTGPEKDSVVRRAYEVGAADSIVFLEALSRCQYSDIMRSIDILAVPSRNEPFGTVVLEGWSAGKPVVATTAGGMKEFIWHNVNGFLVDATPGGLAHGIRSLLADHDHCRALGSNGRRAVEEKFNWDNIAGYTEGVYYALYNY